MVSSAAVMAVLGLAATFLPQELAGAGGVTRGPLPLFVQLGGALYLAFAVLNWMAKDSLIGGIYARPVSLGNLFHFAVGAITLVKAVAAGQRTAGIVAATVIYSIFAVYFAAIVFFWSPVRGKAEP